MIIELINKNILNRIIDGTQTVGNAEKLDGHESTEFLLKTGGKVTGITEFTINGMNLSITALTDRIGLYDNVNARWVLWVLADGTVTLNGTASGNLPLTGGTLSNNLVVSTANGKIALMVASSGIGLMDLSTSKWLIRKLGGSYYVDDDKVILHSGNYSSYALPRSGGNVTGQTVGVNNGLGMLYGDSNCAQVVSKNDANSTDNRRTLLVFNSNYANSVKNALAFRDVVEGSAIDYDVLHTGNKPTGTYTGNGDATERVINTGGIGSALLVTGGDNSYIVTPTGATGVGVNSLMMLHSYNATFVDGVLTLTTDSEYINKASTTYTYQVL